MFYYVSYHQEKRYKGDSWGVPWGLIRKPVVFGLFSLSVLASLLVLFPTSALQAQIPGGFEIPVIEGIRGARNGREASFSLTLILLLSLLSLAPALIMMITSFTKIIIVFDFVRRALALQNMPPNQVLFGLAVFVSVFVMAPTLKEFNEKALQPYLNEQNNTSTFLSEGIKPFRRFMIQQIGKDGASEIGLFVFPVW